MKEIQINKLSLRNFKGCAALELALDGKNASICGDNATGKTTVYDAVTWLLFGKDSRGGSDQEIIKPLDKDGNVKDHEAITCVEAELTVAETGDTDCHGPAGLAMTLRKEMQESWVTRRGSSTTVYDGNEFRYAIDGVPLKKNEFQRRVGELVDEDSFRMLTSVTAFAQDMPWKKRREILYEISGVSNLSDRALMQQMAQEGGEDSRQIAGATGGTGGRIATSPSAPRNDNAVDAETLEELAEMLSGKSLDDLRRVLAAQRKALMGTRSQTPARLDELNRQAAPLEAQDYGAAEKAKAAAEQELERIRRETARIMAEQQSGRQSAVPTEAEIRLKELDAEKKVQDARLAEQRAGIRGKISDLEIEQAEWNGRKLEQQNKTRQEADVLYASNQEFRRKQELALPDLKMLEEAANWLRETVERLESRLDVSRQEAEAYEALVNQDRQEWVSVSQKSFGGATCPTCGQELPMDQMQKAMDSFEEGKKRQLDAIYKTAETHKKQAEQSRRDVEQTAAHIENSRKKLAEAEKTLEEAKKAPREIRDMDGFRDQYDALNAYLAELHGMQYMPGYREKRDALKAELDAVPSEWPEYRQRRQQIEDEISRESDEKARQANKAEERVSALSQEAEGVKAKLREAEAILRGKAVLDGIRQRISELRAEQKRTAAELEQVDRLSCGVEEFIRWKTRFIEDSVNGLFHIVTFRLFREQANGGLEERCDVVVDGVPYNALNNGARINAGMDIIRRLAEHYDVRVPLFVDNAEGVTRLEDAGTQVIRLVVSEQDKRLRIETV